MTEHEMVGCLHSWLDISLNKPWELVMYREARHASIHGITKSLTWLCNWTELKRSHYKMNFTIITVTAWKSFVRYKQSWNINKIKSVKESKNYLPFPLPGHLPNLGIKPTSLTSALAGGLFATRATWEVPKKSRETKDQQS